MAGDKGDKIGLYFLPANEGDYLAGLPPRDLTEEEVASYREREPDLMRHATTPHPATGKALYAEKPGAGTKTATTPKDGE